MQIVRYADAKPGIFAVSRIDPERREEMLAVFNNSGETSKASIKVFSSAGNWERVFVSGAKGITFGPGPDNRLAVELAPWSSLVLRNPQPIEAGTEPLGELQFKVNRNSEIDGRWELKAESTADKVISVAFGVRVKGETEYKFLGARRILLLIEFCRLGTSVPDAPDLEFKAVARDLFGAETSADFEWQRRRRVKKKASAKKPRS